MMRKTSLSTILIGGVLWLAAATPAWNAGWSCARAEDATATSPADDVDAREEKAFQAACDRVAGSIVRIETVGGLERIEDVHFGAGPTTGLIVAPDGYIVSSAFNFIHKPDSILVRLPDGTRKQAELVATDHNRKIVLLKIRPDAPLAVAEIAPLNDLRVGQWAIALGRAFEGDKPAMTVGVVSALGRVWGKAIQTDAIVSPNNYGGPLVDIRGRVMGILVPLSPDAADEMAGVEWYDSGIGFAVPAEFVQNLLPKLKRGEDLWSGVIGVNMAGNLQVGESKLAACTPGSPAAEAGLKAGDRIVEIEGRKIERAADVKRELASRYAGDKMRLVAMRGGDRIECNLELVAKLPPFQHASLGILPKRDGGEGVVIRYVYPAGPAADASLAPEDVILSLDGKPVKDRNELREAIGARKLGEEAAIEFRRGDKTSKISVKLGPLTDGLPPGALPFARGETKPGKEKPPGVGTVTMKVAEFPNEAVLYVPEGYDASVPHGVVVWLHGPGGFDQKELLARWKPLCDKHDLILVAPKATDPAKWAPQESSFVQRLLQQIKSQYSVDPSRVAAYGRDSGGAMAWLVAMRARELVRAVAVLDAPLVGRPPEADPVHRLAVYLGQAKKAPKAREVGQAIDTLRERKIPVTVKDLGEAPRDLTDPEAAELARWVDMLDRI